MPKPDQVESVQAAAQAPVPAEFDLSKLNFSQLLELNRQISALLQAQAEVLRKYTEVQGHQREALRQFFPSDDPDDPDSTAS